METPNTDISREEPLFKIRRPERRNKKRPSRRQPEERPVVQIPLDNPDGPFGNEREPNKTPGEHRKGGVIIIEEGGNSRKL
ncbi:MAG: hypothetical protein ABH832_02640 [bacterium]